MLLKRVCALGIESEARFEVTAVWFFDDDATPQVVFFRKTSLTERVDNFVEQWRRRCEIEQTVLTAAARYQFLETRVDCLKRALVFDFAGHVMNPPREILPDVFVELIDLVGVFERLSHQLSIFILRHGVSTNAQNSHLVETTQTTEIEQRRHQFALCQIASRAENHNNARIGVRKRRLLHFSGIRVDKYC